MDSGRWGLIGFGMEVIGGAAVNRWPEFAIPVMIAGALPLLWGFWGLVNDWRGKARLKLEPWHLQVIGLVGVILFAGVALAGLLWERHWPPQTIIRKADIAAADPAPSPGPPLSAMEAKAVQRANFLHMRRELEEKARGAAGALVTYAFSEEGSPTQEPAVPGLPNGLIRMSQAGGTAVWIYGDHHPVRSLAHVEFATRGETLDVRTLRPTKGATAVQIGERVFITATDERVVQILIAGVLYYGAGDDKGEVRFNYKVYDPGVFLIQAL